MGNLFSVRTARNFQTTKEESWMERVNQNARAFFELRGAPTLAHGGAGAFDLLEERREPGVRKKQALSLVAHAVAIGILVWAGGQTARQVGPPLARILKDPGRHIFPPPKSLPPADKPNQGQGVGGDRGILPPSAGELARRSQIVLLHPRIPDQQEQTLPVEPNILGEEELRRVQMLGSPSM